MKISDAIRYFREGLSEETREKLKKVVKSETIYVIPEWLREDIAEYGEESVRKLLERKAEDWLFVKGKSRNKPMFLSGGEVVIFDEMLNVRDVLFNFVEIEKWKKIEGYE